jgi:hypothetical protein
MFRDLAIVTAIVALTTGPVEAPGPTTLPEAVEGTVRRVDHIDGLLTVSTGRLGLFGRTLEITGDTQIRVGTRWGGIGDIREGATVKAAYETYDGTDIVTRIDVMPSAPAK